MKRLLMSVGIVCAWLITTPAGAQTLEDQLRSQLADARSQLQDLQSQQAQWQAQKAQLEQQRDAAQKELDASKAELSKDRTGSSQDAAALSSERAAHEHADAQLRQLQKTIAVAEAKAKADEAQNTDLAAQWTQANTQIGTCTAKNQQLYKIGNEILDAYSHMSMGSVIASREPFATSERVKLENAAQDYGDQLYKQHFEPAAVPTKNP